MPTGCTSGRSGRGLRAFAILFLGLALSAPSWVIGCASSAPRGDVPVSAGGDCCEEGLDGRSAADPSSPVSASETSRAEPTVRRADYALPTDLVLTDQFGTSRPFSEWMTADVPVGLNFVFTTCTTICPVMTATFARFPDELGDDGTDLRLFSITLDPEYDTPPVLKEYWSRFGGDEQWVFLTGDASALQTLYREYEVMTGTNKMSHLPFALFRFPGDEQWTRVDGLVGTASLATAYRRLREDQD